MMETEARARALRLGKIKRAQPQQASARPLQGTDSRVSFCSAAEETTGVRFVLGRVAAQALD